MTRSTDTIIIGAGQAGLATSRFLSDAGRDHVVFERGHLAERWRSERWDSLRLLTPNWQSRLPGHEYTGSDPEGYMMASEVIRYFENYAESFSAPVEEETTVESVTRTESGYHVVTSQDEWLASNVVVATGFCDRPCVPALASALGPTSFQTVPSWYKNPDSLPDGGVLVVGASASGLQIADELARSGHDVTLAVGSHTRLPRRYRGMDIMWWLDRMGTLDKTIDEVADPHSARRDPSLQLIGSVKSYDLDLGTARSHGVKLAGRVVGADADRVQFADDLEPTMSAADAQLGAMLRKIDRHIHATGMSLEVDDPDGPAPLDIPAAPRDLNLADAGIGNVIWATGYRRSYPWLEVPVIDERGDIIQRRGVTPSAGLYVVGMRFQNRRNSSFIDGARHDARLVTDHIAKRAGTRIMA